MNVTYITWAASCSRSDNTARELGGHSYMIYWGWLGSHPVTVWLKYFGQSLETLWRLFRERPEAVFVMSPPVIAVLPVYLYCALRRIRFVIDAHTAAFLHPRWRKFQWLQRYLSRRAATTIVTNDHLREMVEAGGGHATIVRDVPVRYEISEKFPLNGKFSVAVVCSFNYDEPIAEIFRAAARLPAVQFYVTGNIKDLDPKVAETAPENLTLTGFLSDSAFGSLLTGAGAVLTLTTRDHTMLRGAYEAIYQGTPVIISNWELLRNAFDEGAIHIDNSEEAIVAAVREMQANRQKYLAEARHLRDRKQQEFAETRRRLIERLKRHNTGRQI